MTGAILHFSSTILISLFDLTSTSDESDVPASVQATREQKKLEEAWQSSSSKGEGTRQWQEASLENRYADWQGRDAGSRKDKGLSGQTILEEDDSEDF